MRDIVHLLLSVKAGAYSVEAGNARHEHEWRVWQDVKLPPGKILIPGVVSHATNVVEHPELVAERIVRFARLVGRENVIAGTDCGLGGRVHQEVAWAKLEARWWRAHDWRRRPSRKTRLPRCWATPESTHTAHDP
jgi:5-methyltetrahydropteroyltriglutamate--homocysteine methyltransferase